MPDSIEYLCKATPCGDMLLGAFDGALCLCEWVNGRHTYADSMVLHGAVRHLVPAVSDITRRAAEQLDEYFAGKRHEFSVPLLTEGTDFQCMVWQAVQGLPYSATVSYTVLASRIGRPNAVRAVGAAVGRNRLQIIIPCHRVIASDGTLAGYAGGIEAKRYLLELERSGI